MGTKIELGIWFPIYGFPAVKAYLRQLKLELATRLNVVDNKQVESFEVFLKQIGAPLKVMFKKAYRSGF